MLGLLLRLSQEKPENDQVFDNLGSAGYEAFNEDYTFTYVTFKNIRTNNILHANGDMQLKMEQCTMINCQSNYDSAMAIDSARRIEITQFCFRDSYSSASTNGCLIRVSSDPKEITKLSSVSITGVTSGDYGVEARRGEINNINISQNSVAKEMMNIISLESSVFHYCYCVDSSSSTSGAVFVQNLNSKYLDHLLFYKNLGKAMSIKSSSISLTDCGFAGNILDVYVDSSTVSFTNSQFTNFSSNDATKVTFVSNCYTKGYGLPNKPFDMPNPVGDPKHECNCAQNALSGDPYKPGEPETPFRTEAMTAESTPYSTPHSTAYLTPFRTAEITNKETPANTPAITAHKTPYITAHQTPMYTPMITAKETPNVTPFSTPVKTVNPDCVADEGNLNNKKNIRKIKFVLAFAQAAQNI